MDNIIKLLGSEDRSDNLIALEILVSQTGSYKNAAGYILDNCNEVVKSKYFDYYYSGNMGKTTKYRWKKRWKK